MRIFLFFHLKGNYVIRIGTRQDRYVSMREFLNHAVLSMSDPTMAVSSKYTQDLSVQIVFFTFSCKWFLFFYFWAVVWIYIVDLFAALHELAWASARTLLKLASPVRALLKPYGDTLRDRLSSKRITFWQAKSLPYFQSLMFSLPPTHFTPGTGQNMVKNMTFWPQNL